MFTDKIFIHRGGAIFTKNMNSYFFILLRYITFLKFEYFYENCLLNLKLN